MEKAQTRYVYECPRCHKLSESSTSLARIKCGDCLIERVEVVEMIALGMFDEESKWHAQS